MIFFNRMLAEVVKDMRIMEKNLIESSLDYTILRPGELSKGSGSKIVHKEGFDLPKGFSNRTVHRVQTAEFMVDQINDSTYIKKGVAIGSEK
jgi:hypothetical protein